MTETEAEYNKKKDMLIKVCETLIKQRLIQAGVNNAINIKLREFIDNPITPIESYENEIAAVKDAIVLLSESTIPRTAIPLIKTNNKSILNNFFNNVKQNKEINITYQRTEIEEYLNLLEEGKKEWKKKILGITEIVEEKPEAEGSLEGLKPITQEKGKLKNKFILLPATAAWEDIEIRFKNIYDIEIMYKEQLIKESNYEKMELYDKKTKGKKPNKQWGFLTTLSTNNGKFELGKIFTTKEKDKYKQYKKDLSKTLQTLFDISENPFDEEKGTYQTRFKIKPMPSLRGDGEIWDVTTEEKRQKFFDDEMDKKTENHKINTNLDPKHY